MSLRGSNNIVYYNRMMDGEGACVRIGGNEWDEVDYGFDNEVRTMCSAVLCSAYALLYGMLCSAYALLYGMLCSAYALLCFCSALWHALLSLSSALLMLCSMASSAKL